MNLPFIYKYKPDVFRDFEIDPDIVNILETLITMNNLNVLFIGDSGSGKSSLINVLVKEYYKGHSKYHENVLEIKKNFS